NGESFAARLLIPCNSREMETRMHVLHTPLVLLAAILQTLPVSAPVTRSDPLLVRAVGAGATIDVPPIGRVRLPATDPPRSGRGADGAGLRQRRGGRTRGARTPDVVDPATLGPSRAGRRALRCLRPAPRVRGHRGRRVRQRAARAGGACACQRAGAAVAPRRV